MLDTIDEVIYKQQKFFSHCSEAGEFKIKTWAESVSSEDLLPGSQTTLFFLCPHAAEGTRVLSGVSFIKELISGGLQSPDLIPP